MELENKMNPENKIIKIPNINSYDQEIIDGTLVLTPKKTYITESILLSKDLTNSNIIYCKLKDAELNKLKYRAVLIEIYKDIPTNQILQNTTFNFKLKKINEDGYSWCDDINMSMQNKNSNGTIIEIIKMIKITNYKFEIGIKLSNDDIVYYKN